jgi:hypothetical protein
MKLVFSSEILLPIYKATRRHSKEAIISTNVIDNGKSVAPVAFNKFRNLYLPCKCVAIIWALLFH